LAITDHEAASLFSCGANVPVASSLIRPDPLKHKARDLARPAPIGRKPAVSWAAQKRQHGVLGCSPNQAGLLVRALVPFVTILIKSNSHSHCILPAFVSSLSPRFSANAEQLRAN
jgi:hypothetical protein